MSSNNANKKKEKKNSCNSRVIRAIRGSSLLLLILAAGCAWPVQGAPKATPTAIPEIPFEQMPAQPPHGSSGGASIGDAYIPSLGNIGYDVQAYDLALDLDIDHATLAATALITATVTLDDLGRLSLDFSGYTVDAVRVNGGSAAFYRDQPQEKLIVDLPRAYAKGKTVVLQVVYHGAIRPQISDYAPGGGPVGLLTPEGKRTTVFAEPDGAHAWFPCNDHPLDKATFRVEATVPAGLTAVSNGRLAETRQEGSAQKAGRATYIWVEDDPMATYLLLLAVGDYRRIDDPPLGQVQIRHYVFADDTQAEKVFSQSAEVLQFLSDLIAPYPFGEFGNVEVGGNWGAMETQTMVMFAQNLLPQSDASAGLAHEAAHHWFGDSLSLSSWGDIWLNEGFATYFEGLWREHAGFMSQHQFYDYMEGGILGHAQEAGHSLVDPAPASLFGANSYGKGAWVLRMLEQELGKEVLLKGLREYYRRFAFANAGTADLQKVLEETSGKDLKVFFQQWVYTAGNPQLDVTWTSQPGAAGAAVSVQVCQGEEIYNLPLEIELQAGGQGPAQQAQRETLSVDERQERADFSLPFTPLELQVDPDQELLAGVTVAQVEALSPCNP